MKKYPLSPAGFMALQEELFRYDDEQLFGEALAIAGDFRAYMASRFEIDVFRLEVLRSLEERTALTIGWCLAAVLINRQPFSIQDSVLTALIHLNGLPQEYAIGLDWRIQVSAR